MKSLLKGGILAAVMGLSVSAAAHAMDPAMMEVSPSDPMFDAMVLQELRRLNDEIQALSAFAMSSEDEEVQELAQSMFDEAMEMEEMLSQLRTRTLMRGANSDR